MGTMAKEPEMKTIPKVLSHDGRHQTLRQWSEELNWPYSTLYYRIARLGWTVERALTEPPRRYRSDNKEEKVAD
jgi:hypothetical protein